MGCSSGNLKLEGEFDPSGIALDYLIAGWSVEFFITMCVIFNGFILTTILTIEIIVPHWLRTCGL